MIRKRQCCVLLLAAYAFIMLAGRGHAQNTGYYEEPAYGFSQAVRLYENNKFNAAKRAFDASGVWKKMMSTCARRPCITKPCAM